MKRRAAAWVLPAALVAGMVSPLLGILVQGGRLFPEWSRVSLPFHSTLEMGGAVLGAVLAVIILFSRQIGQTSHRVWIVCALLAMAVLDLFHSSVPVGDTFVWLHCLASLAGGLLFALVWLPPRDIARATMLVVVGATLLVATLVGALCASLPPAVVEGSFTPAAMAITLLSGGLFVLAAVKFAVRYARTRRQEEVLFLTMCYLFALSGLLFPLSSIWSADWWFWHLLRFGGYLFAFWLALFSYRRTENEIARQKLELQRYSDHLELLVAERNRELIHELAERRQAEVSLAGSEAEFRRLSQEFHGLLDAIPDNLTLLDRELKILWANNGAAKGVGKRPEELFGQHCFTIWHDRTEPCMPCPVSESFATGRPANTVNTTPDGRIWDLRTIPLPDGNGGVLKVIEVGRDITAHRKLEAQFRQAQKMESVGRLAGGVAHDFNNMLTIIIGFGEEVMAQLNADDPIGRDVAEMVKAARRSADLTRQLLAFSRQQPISPRVVDLNELTENSKKMLKRLVGEDIDLQFAPKEDLWKIQIDPTQVDQILANLTVNARDAIAGVGLISISTDNVVLDETDGAFHEGFTPGEYVMVGFTDSGSGMDEKTRQKIFDPFFTTKEEGKGTGLGLSTVYGIVKQNHGVVDVHSEPGRGTSFTIYFPRHCGQAGKQPEIQREAAAGGRETLLLVEDESIILAMCKRLMEKQGYNVLAANRPEEAVALCEQYQGEIDLLVSDVIMPTMNGRELMERISLIRPGIKVLFMSGYTADIIGREGALAVGTHFIQKPFNNYDFIQKISYALSH